MRAIQMAICALCAATGLMACQATGSPTPAVLVRADAESLARLKSAVAAAMGKARVDFGSADLAASPEIPVLPPRPGPFEGQSLALPTYFDLAIKDGTCVVIERSTGKAFDASEVSCKPTSD